MAQIDPPLLPPRLYRYRKVPDIELAERELRAISDQYLWFSPYRTLNDPMEGIYGASEWLTQQPEYRELVREIRNQKRSVGICCFSDTYDNELMWAHYSANYGGICVGYSTKRLLSGLGDGVHIARVAYNNQPPRIGRDEGGCPQQASIRILSHKKTCWLYEREWRLLAGPEVVQVPGPLTLGVKDAVKCVYIGSRVSEDVKHKLVLELTRMNISIRIMKVSGYDHAWTEID